MLRRILNWTPLREEEFIERERHICLYVEELEIINENYFQGDFNLIFQNLDQLIKDYFRIKIELEKNKGRITELSVIVDKKENTIVKQDNFNQELKQNVIQLNGENLKLKNMLESATPEESERFIHQEFQNRIDDLVKEIEKMTVELKQVSDERRVVLMEKRQLEDRLNDDADKMQMNELTNTNLELMKEMKVVKNENSDLENLIAKERIQSQGTISALEKTIENMQSELDNMKMFNNQKETPPKSTDTPNSEISNDISEKDSIIEDLQDQVEKQKTIISVLENEKISEISTLNIEIEKKKSIIEDLISQNSAPHVDNSSLNVHDENTITELENKIMEIKKKYEIENKNLERENISKESTIHELERKISDLTERISKLMDSETVNKELQGEIDQKNREIEEKINSEKELHRTVESLESELDQKNESLKKLTEDILETNALKSQLESKENEILFLKDQLDQTNTDITSESNIESLNDLNTEILKLQNDIGLKDTSLSSLQAEMDQRNNDIEEKIISENVMVEKIESLESELTEKNNKQKEQYERITSLESELAQINEKVIFPLQDEINQKNEEIERYITSDKEKEKKISSLELDVNQLEKSLQKSEANVEELRLEIDSFEQLKNEKNTQIENKNSDTSVEISNLQAEIVDKELEIKILKDEIKQKDVEIGEIHSIKLEEFTIEGDSTSTSEEIQFESRFDDENEIFQIIPSNTVPYTVQILPSFQLNVMKLDIIYPDESLNKTRKVTLPCKIVSEEQITINNNIISISRIPLHYKSLPKTIITVPETEFIDVDEN